MFGYHLNVSIYLIHYSEFTNSELPLLINFKIGCMEHFWVDSGFYFQNFFVGYIIRHKKSILFDKHVFDIFDTCSEH